MMERIRVKKDGTSVRETFTAEEEAARNADIAKVKAEDDARAADIKAVADAKAEAKIAQDAVDAQTAIDKASANVKLKAAEYTPLTEAEADAITK